MSDGGRAETIAAVTAPFGRLPAGVVALVAEAALRAMAERTDKGALDLRPDALRLSSTSPGPSPRRRPTCSPTGCRSTRPPA